MTDLSVIILNYNTKEVTLACLKSLIESEIGERQVEVIVVDNASTDGSVSAFKQFFKTITTATMKFSLIENRTNVGFAGGNNRGIRNACGKYILLLNSDVLVEKNTLIKQIAFMEDHPEYVVSTCKVLLENGKLDPACHRGFPTPWASVTYFTKLEKLFANSKVFGQYHQTWKDSKIVHDVDVISGAFFMVKKEVLDKTGLLDEGFFMYAEDIDLCLRIRQMGFRIGYNPYTSVLHLKGISGRNKINTSEKKTHSPADYHFWDTMQLFYRKHYSKQYPKLLMWTIFKMIDWKKKQYV